MQVLTNHAFKHNTAPTACSSSAETHKYLPAVELFLNHQPSLTQQHLVERKTELPAKGEAAATAARQQSQISILGPHQSTAAAVTCAELHCKETCTSTCTAAKQRQASAVLDKQRKAHLWLTS
jgi:hypothetical protein